MPFLRVSPGVSRAAIVLGFASLLRKHAADLLFRAKLRSAFRWMGLGHNLDGLTSAVRNHVGRQLIIRRLVLSTATGDFLMNPMDQISLSYAGQHPKITRKQRKEIAAATKEVPLSPPEFQLRRVQSSPTLDEFAAVDPFTSRDFLLPYELLAIHTAPDPVAFDITIDYEAWIGKRRIVRIRITDGADQIRKMLDFASREIRSGNLNSARAKWGKPPVRTNQAQGTS
jgi:hypothetical protein